MASDDTTLVKALTDPILRDICLRCADLDGGAKDKGPAQRWAMRGSKIDHGHQNPFDDLAFLLIDLGVLSDEVYPVVQVSAADLGEYFTTEKGACRLVRFATDPNRMVRLIGGFAKLANWYWRPAYPLGPEPFPSGIQRTPALKALIAAGYVEDAEGLMAWTNAFGALIMQFAPGDYGWSMDLANPAEGVP